MAVEGNCSYDSDSPMVGEHTVYDVASITKSVPTACLALKLVEERRMKLKSPLVDFVPEYEGTFRDEIRIEHLLTHTLDFDFRMSDKKDLAPEKILESVFKADLRTPPGTTFSYANATSILLGLVIERVIGESLDIAAGRMLFSPLMMEHTTFFPEKLDCADIAPTEDDPWRGRIICGEVHDESAWALRTIMTTGSAGLFSTIADLVRFLSMLLNRG